MTIYLINMGLILFWAMFPEKISKKTYCWIVGIQWTLISGLRHISIGADTESYSYWFENTKLLSWQQIIKINWEYLVAGRSEKDPGFTLFIKVFQLFCDNYQVFLLLVAAIFSGALAYWIYKNSSIPYMSFMIYSALFYAFFALTGHRQTLATALIVLIGYKYIKERKLLKFAIVAFMAFMLHKSSLIFIPYYFISCIPITFPYVVVIAVLAITGVVLGAELYGPMADFLGFGEGMIENEGGEAEVYAIALLFVCVALLVMYTVIKKNRADARYLYNLVMLTIITTALVLQNQSFMRIQQYFSLIIMIMIPELVLCLKKEERIIGHIAVIAVCVLYIMRNNPQYMFFWQ